MSNLLSPLLFEVLVILLFILMLWLVIRSIQQLRDHDRLLRIDTHMEDLQSHLDSLEQLMIRLQTDQIQASSITREQVMDRLADSNDKVQGSLSVLREQLGENFSRQHTQFEQRQNEASNSLNEGLWKNLQTMQTQLASTLNQNTQELGQRFEHLTKQTDQRLSAISDQVDKRLADGFEKTTATFSDVIKRLALIDEAQKKITELSGNVVSLQEILADKRSRGAFGEVQLNSLIKNILPESGFSFQHTLSNGMRVDCLLLLPKPTGNVAVDAKFPLESFRKMTNIELASSDRQQASRQFKMDIKKHIQDIAKKYILKNETSDGAMMFIPAEAVFAEIQAHHPDLVELAHRSHVWMVSPTTLWAILNTARAVLKDAATREQVDLIQEHLGLLAEDFGRFKKRMDGLARHIEQAHEDVQQVNTSARKISARFDQIERVELDESLIKKINPNKE